MADSAASAASSDTAIAPALKLDTVTGLVLSGGQGQRMGGQDKGLLPWRGEPLVLHVARRLAPQVGRLVLNANRHLPTYRAFGWPVWPDAATGAPAPFDGPLAGLLCGVHRCETDWLVTAPCDSPQLPADLVQRLAHAAMQAGVPAAIARTAGAGGARRHPVFCLLACGPAGPLLQRCFAGGLRRMGDWLAEQPHATADFDDAAAFMNLNTPDDWQAAP